MGMQDPFPAGMPEKLNDQDLRERWKQEEDIAHIHGWDFSHLDGRYDEGEDIPWDYDAVVRSWLKPELKLMDYDTGGGEYLLSLGHPYANTAATEGYPPNVELCRRKLIPLGIDLRECSDAAHIPFDSESFDLVINRHGDLSPRELYRILKPGGMFITQQVGDENDRDLVQRVLPGQEMPFPGHHLSAQRKAFEEEGFGIVEADEFFGSIRFYDVGAFVWFARIIEWEFPGFSVDRCFESLMKMQREIETNGMIRGTTHRYLIVAQKGLK